MRLGERELHPVLWKAFDAYESSFYAGGLSKDRTGALLDHQKTWWNEYGRGVLLWSGFWLALIFALAYWGKDYAGPLPMFVGMLGAGLHAYIGFKRNRRTATVDEIAALLPALDLDEPGRLYAEIVVDLFRTDLDARARDEALKALNALMDQHAALELRRKGLEAALSRSDIEAVALEVRQIESKRDAATDADARAIYERSLELARGRLAATERYRPYLERVDAQQEVVRQTLLQVRADLGRAKAAPSVWTASTLDGLRTSTLSIRTRAEEIERAVDELATVQA